MKRNFNEYRKIFKEAIETSAVISTLRNIDEHCSHFGREIVECYYNSYASRPVNYFVEVLTKENPLILRNSRSALWIAKSYKKLKGEMVDDFNTSLIDVLAADAKKEFSLYAIKTISAILILAVIVNLTLSFIFKRQLGISASVLSNSLLIVGIVGLSSDADWAAIKRSSIILRILFR